MTFLLLNIEWTVIFAPFCVYTHRNAKHFRQALQVLDSFLCNEFQIWKPFVLFVYCIYSTHYTADAITPNIAEHRRSSYSEICPNRTVTRKSLVHLREFHYLGSPFLYTSVRKGYWPHSIRLDHRLLRVYSV